MESNMVLTETTAPVKALEEIKPKAYQDGQMTSSIISLTSSLTSPVDSGVQLLDSESEITSLMSTSGTVYDFDSTGGEDGLKDNEALKDHTPKVNNRQKSISQDSSVDHHKCRPQTEGDCVPDSNNKPQKAEENSLKSKVHVMTKSDIDNHNVHHIDVHTSAAVLNVGTTTSCAAFINTFKHEDQFQENQEFDEATGDILKLEPILLTNEPKQSDTSDDLMNISLNSYELLDYTLQNVKPTETEVPSVMHVSMSEEVQETSVLNMPQTVPEIESEKPPADDQIVYRRQRRKKSKSDTPKKRVSFHEDILNSTKIDDIHINHGFITHEPDISMSFFERGFMRKPDVVKGRYSWAAEGDTPYYQKKTSEREVKSDIYINRARVFSTSSSSSASISSSIDEEDSGSGNQNSDDNVVKREPTLKLPKSSCLKKTKSNKKYIDTNIVEEETNLRKKKSESNLLDTHIFGSLKNIFSFSTSVPLAERGVPEGQEDITVYSSSDTGLHKPTKYTGNEFASPKTCDGYEVQPAPVRKIGNLNLELAKTNLKLTQSEGFYPNYPNNQILPNNIIICDSNVYEHKGISYSYEFENFQKTFEQQNKPKSSTIYQMLLKELNFFKKKEKKAIEKEAKENMEFYSSSVGKDTKHEEYFDDKSTTSSSIRKYASSATIDFSDNEMNWDFSDTSNTRHLHSPKRRINRNSHYSIKSDISDDKIEIELPVKPPAAVKSSSKTSLINRFLRNVTMKKMIDLRLQKKQKLHRQYLPLYVKNAKANPFVNKEIDLLLEKEIIEGRKRKKSDMGDWESHLAHKFKTEIFRSAAEVFAGAFPVYSAYTTTGESKPLMMVLSDTTLYIASFKPNSSCCNHFVLPYTELNTVLIGPNAQTIHISNYDKDMQCMISTGSESITNAVIKHVEIAMRKDMNKPNLLAVKQLTMQDMVNLRKAICKQTVVSKGEEYFYYCIVNIQDYNTDAYETPLGPSKEGPLMFKTAETDSRWETAYFILKAGILYMLSSPSHRLPMRVLPLINGACQGARRVYNCTRPHTFQIQVGIVTLHLAAPDEYVASEWLQSLVHAASKTYGSREKLPAQCCSLLMTSEHILTIREAFPSTLHSSLGLREHQPIKGTQTLSCASIADITSFKLPCAEQSWCILEFACREVHETSGDWIIYFTTNSELEKFISTLEMLWTYHNEGESFPLSTIPETDILSKKCTDTYNMIQNAWVSLQVNLKSF